MGSYAKLVHFCSGGAGSPQAQEAETRSGGRENAAEADARSETVVRTEAFARCNIASCTLFVTYVMWLAFLWFMPQWSHYFNDHMMMFNHRWVNNMTGPNNFLCMTPPEEMHCSDGRNFADLPIVQWRMNVSGRRNVGCGCGQGVMGEGSCGQDGPYVYTISSFISTPPATGAFLGLLGPGIVSMWWAMERFHQLTAPPYPLRLAQYLSLLAFQVLFAFFSIGQDCIYLELHFWTTATFQAALWLYNVLYIVVACMYGPRRSNVIWIVLAGAAVSMGSSSMTQLWARIVTKYGLVGAKWVSDHGFYIFECLALTGCFSVGPALMVLGEVQVTVEVRPKTPKHGDPEAGAAKALQQPLRRGGA